MRLRRGKLIPRADGKRIEEWVGAATTGTRTVSVARMLAPPGWSEPAQRPEFDEVVAVLAGELTMIIDGKRERIARGEVGLVRRGERVVFRNDAAVACDYFSVCAPAFRRDLTHAEAAPSNGVRRSRVLVEAAHPGARPLRARVERRARAFLEQLDVRGVELSVSLVGDRTIRRLNRTWRKKDRSTDVLSFPAGESPRGAPGPRPLGDVVISVQTARRVSRQDGRALHAEVDRYLAHGILHLLGYDHEKSPREAKRMLALEESLLGGGAVPPLTQLSH
jgi:probable rRNA maturation factor